MNMRKLAALALAAVLSVAAGKPAPQNWNNKVSLTPEGNHVLGNPAAQMKLVEFVSYTCPHCAEFERRADGALRVAYVAPGKLSVEVRNYVRDPIDLAVALLTNCGAPQKFFLNHTAFLRSQDRWLATYAEAGATQRARWQHPDLPTRMRYIATDFRFYEIIATRGYDRRAADACLADEAEARRLAEQTAEAQRQGIRGTPSFMLDGAVLAGTHDWQALDLQIRARF